MFYYYYFCYTKKYFTKKERYDIMYGYISYTVMYIYIYLCMKNFTESVSGIFAINLFKYKNTALKWKITLYVTKLI